MQYRMSWRAIYLCTVFFPLCYHTKLNTYLVWNTEFVPQNTTSHHSFIQQKKRSMSPLKSSLNLLILWLSFFWRSLASAWISASLIADDGSCLMLRSLPYDGSSFSESASEPDSIDRMSSSRSSACQNTGGGRKKRRRNKRQAANSTEQMYV